MAMEASESCRAVAEADIVWFSSRSDCFLPLARAAGAFKHRLAQAVEHLRLFVEYALLHGLALARFLPPQKRQGGKQRQQHDGGADHCRQGRVLFKDRRHGILRNGKSIHILYP